MTPAGMRGTLVTPRGEVPFATPLLGRYNLPNLLAAAAAAEALDLPHAAVDGGARGAAAGPGPDGAGRPRPAVPGVRRLRPHRRGARCGAALGARDRGAGKVAVVFGCGGDRDRGKRPLMGRVAGELADLPIVTSDNPRSEDPLAILAAVEEGVRASGRTRLPGGARPPRGDPRGDRRGRARAGPCWSRARGTSGSRSSATRSFRSPISTRSSKALEERFGTSDRG